MALVILSSLLMSFVILALIFLQLRAWATIPLQAMIKSLVTTIPLLIGSGLTPTMKGELKLSADWGDLMKIGESKLYVNNEGESHLGYAWIAVTLLLIVCVFAYRDLEISKKSEDRK